ncbi:MAG: 3'-to-5' exoribonuclease RNase R [uncultured Solirubrobacteraceae bacterium]|uniref:3'-to-5' exoribonuclease RNase R n=1 Tax=uncultured Solirubrobacteraceae bacterium TaxID=1162706 RepID=A0A6J4RXN1_9ACTN|nr:MAG: 3'-to-5' exoribonuclease RNase R [uncultured Solirubrobacteraceae bacterium]
MSTSSVERFLPAAVSQLCFGARPALSALRARSPATTLPGLRRLRPTPAVPADLAAGLAAIRSEHAVPGDFPAAVAEEAEAAARSPRLPDEDRRDVELFTLDPAGSRDLDQAVALERRADGYRVHYAIADVAAFVTPGGAVDAEAHRRVMTRYLPDGNAPLHPRVLSEGAASLLPGQDRPALLWTFELDGRGGRTAFDVRRAVVRSREQLEYASADAAEGDDRLVLLREVGALLRARERARGAISLPVPEQEIVLRDGRYSLEACGPLPIEDDNAQISLLTGMTAAELMLAGGSGLLRTLPPAPPDAEQRMRRVARALGVDWPAAEPLGDLVRRLDALRATEAALIEEATSLLRGAGYAAFSGAAPEQPLHAGIGAPYAHVTAPLRRLADRYAAEAALAAHQGVAPPQWVLDAIPRLPEEMTAGGRAAGTVERACVDLVEALLLSSRVGEEFAALVIDRMGKNAVEIQLADPPVRAACAEPAPDPGEDVIARLVTADPQRRAVRFEAVGP